jgi:hypothetical protein
MEEIKFDIVEYLGQIEGGIFVLLSLNYQSQFSEGIFYYKKGTVALTIENKLENQLDCVIEEWSGYHKLLLQIVERVVPYDEMINIVNDFDRSTWEVIYPNKS